MKILVIGSGGREHALAWKLAQSPNVQTVYVAPGNAGTAREPNLKNVALKTIPELIAFAKQENIYLTVVGPDQMIADGCVDAFRAEGLKIFGATKAAGQLESSKDFAKRFMQRHSIPTAKFATFSDAAQAHAYVDENGAPIVIKADGLALGKGVVVAMTLDEAHAAIDMMLTDNKFGDAGARVVIEEFMSGEEASFIVIADGKNALALVTTQDHKRIGEGDTGPNTGGMGAYSPAPVVTPEVHARVMREIINPTLKGMAAEGMPYSGFLYAGLMISADGAPKVVEFNARLGDPETQPIMLRMKSDLVDLIEASFEQKLDHTECEWDRRATIGVVMAASGYPDNPRKGDVIEGLPANGNTFGEDCHVFHAGTAIADDKLVTSGGRVLCVTALGETIKLAQKRAYEVVEQIRWKDVQYRKDIGWRAVKR
jgi:phosphoribosylamine---glycine ligase